MSVWAEHFQSDDCDHHCSDCCPALYDEYNYPSEGTE
jgi:hypothetical protein